MRKLLSVDTLGLDLLEPYDAFLATLGFESRAINASQRVKLNAKQQVACAFSDRHVLAYSSNREWFKRAGFDIAVVKEREIEAWTNEWLDLVAQQSPGNQEIRFCVDISSMSRLRLASLLAGVMRMDGGKPCVVDFLYTIAHGRHQVRNQSRSLMQVQSCRSLQGGQTNQATQRLR
jgi:hypothetical protein